MSVIEKLRAVLEFLKIGWLYIALGLVPCFVLYAGLATRARRKAYAFLVSE